MAEEQPDRLPSADFLCRAEARRPARRRPHHMPRIRAPERRVAPRRHRHLRVEQGTQPPQVGQVLGRNVRGVLRAPLDDEVRLGHHGEPVQVAQGIGGQHRAVLDPVAVGPPGRVERGQRERELDAGHAVHRYRPPRRVRGRDVHGELVERRQRGVVEQELHRPERDLGMPRRQSHGGGHAVQALQERPVRGGAGQGFDGALRGVRGGVGEAGHAEFGGRGADLAEAGRAGLGPGQPGGEPVVHPPQPAGRLAVGVAFHAGQLAAVEAEQADGGRVDHPQRAGAMLYADRAVRYQPVQRVPVEDPGDGLVVRGAAQPRAGRPGSVGRGEPGREFGRGPHVRRAGPDAVPRGGERQQVDMVVVQPGQQRAARRVVFVFAGDPAQSLAEVGDEAAADPHIGFRHSERPGATVPDQHPARR
jgi:hypothetical protein